MNLLQSLFPALSQRQNAKRYNRMAELADRVENTRRRYSNQALGREAAFNVWVNDTNSRKVLRTLGRNLGALQRELLEYANATDGRKVQQQMSDLQAMGAMYARNALNGIGHTAVAKQIEATTRQAAAETRASFKREEQADRHRFAQTARETVASAMDAIPSNLVTANLDFNYSKSEKMKVGNVWGSAFDDVMRLVATYYSGGIATPYIDAVRGWDQKRNAAWSGTQSAYDRIYGPGVKQIGSYNAPDLTGLVGMAGNMFGAGGRAGAGGAGGRTVSGIHGSKTVGRPSFSWGAPASRAGNGFASNGWGRIATVGMSAFLGGR